MPTALKGNRCAFITGASSGFGLLISVCLARAGYDVVATMRNFSAKSVLLEAAARAGVTEQIDIQQLDVTDGDSIERTVRYALERFGGIDVLVNNAGYAVGGFVEEVPLDTWRKQFDTNVFGLIAVTQAVLPQMRERGQGRIINISSISGRIGFPAMGPYAASKHAVEGFSEALRLELLPYGVDVVLVEPASYQTSIWQKGLDDSQAMLQTSAYRQQAVKLTKGAQMMATSGGDPNEVAELVCQIATAKRPKFRYPIGQGAKALDRAKRLLPWRSIERIVARRLAKETP